MRNSPIPSAPVRSSAATSSRSPALTISVMRWPSFVTGGSDFSAANVARRFWRQREARRRTLPPSPASARTSTAHSVTSSSSRSPSAIVRRTSLDAAEHRHAHRARDDDDVRGQRPFLQHHALQPAPVVFEQFGGPEVARDQDRVLAQAHLRGGAQSAPTRSGAAGWRDPPGRACGRRAADRRSGASACGCAAARARSRLPRSARCRSPR